MPPLNPIPLASVPMAYTPTDGAYSRDPDLFLKRLANTNTLAECEALQRRIKEARMAQYASGDETSIQAAQAAVERAKPAELAA